MTIGQEQAGAQESAVTAIDVALEPDETMIGRAQAANATLLQNFPKGFSLDATHHPARLDFRGLCPDRRSSQGLRRSRPNPGEGKLHRLEIDRVSNITTSRSAQSAWAASWSSRRPTCFASNLS